MMGLLAYLPQPVWEVGSTVLAVYTVGLGALVLVKGDPWKRPMSSRAVRLIGAVQIVLGIGIGASGFLVHAEPPCGQCGQGPWGSTKMIVAMALWLALLTAITAINGAEVPSA
jgi:hypothetical protein